MNRLADRVRELMHGHDRPAWMDERAAAALLYPARQVQATTINPPLNHEHPGQLAEADGVRGEPLFERVPDFSS